MFFLHLLSQSRTTSIVCKTIACSISWTLLFYHDAIMWCFSQGVGFGERQYVLVFMEETDFCVI